MITVSDPRPEVKVARVHIRCTGTIKHGKLAGHQCGKLLAEPRTLFWEIDMASEALQQCVKCGKPYTLAEYK